MPRFAVLVAILIILGAGTASARDTWLYAPMLSSPTGGELHCSATNVGKKPIAEIYVEVNSLSGGAGSANCSNVPPQSSFSSSGPCWTGLIGSTRAVCIVRITGGSHKSVRAAFSVVDSSGATILSVPATK